MLNVDPDAVVQPVTVGEEKGLPRDSFNVQIISADELCEIEEVKQKAGGMLSAEPLVCVYISSQMLRSERDMRLACPRKVKRVKTRWPCAVGINRVRKISLPCSLLSMT
ncbi:hypothetical protein TNCV_2752971 [Trichonephila clavipes]|nr:hypothetical protein TNCV_2752971 [Trichonephila clavipes]